MIETFAALLFGHVVADFLLQTGWMVARKRAPQVQLLHAALVYGATALAIGHPLSIEVALLTGAHLAIDLAKSYGTRATLSAFLADQAAHLATLAALAMAAPDLWAAGLWADATAAPGAMTLVAGLVLTVRAGSFAVPLLLATLEPTTTGPTSTDAGLARAGALIGILERGLIFVLILAGQPGGVGFLVAAKSVLRFSTVQAGAEPGGDRQVSEYIIIGTLASFGWALVMAFATVSVLDRLPPILPPL